jgi:3-hydroxyisobutyrate dehydrogenase-like beta-hydroxyacid dehydrogenase
MATTVGLLHPGDMGVAVGATLRAGGARVFWASAGRSAATRARAEQAGLEDAGTVADVARRSDVVVSVCPPASALDVAREVMAAKFSGLYIDGNAVAPSTAREVGTIVEEGGATFVDGGIIGSPPTKREQTRLYLAGSAADRAAALFAAGPLDAVVVDGKIGAASALKMAYASWTKGSQALLMAVRALAMAEGVDEALIAEWQKSIPDLPQRSESAVKGTSRKAWRFVGEMEEIADTYASVGLPRGFHEAAAAVYERLARYKDAPAAPSVSQASDALRGRA